MNRPELLTRSITGFFIVAITLAAIVYSPWTYLAWLCVIVLLGTFEFFRLLKLSGTFLLNRWIPFLLTFVVACTGYIWINEYEPLPVFALLPMLLGAMFLVQLRWVKDAGNVTKSLHAGYSACMYLGLPAICGCFFLYGGYDYRFVLLPVIMIWLNDVGAYLIGSIWGRHKIAPSISPGKSVEGSIGGLVLVLITGFILSLLWPEMPLAYIVSLSLTVSFFALAGDLWESALKRVAGVKDSGNILPGHGGILDRYDSLLFVMPVAAIAYYIFVL